MRKQHAHRYSGCASLLLPAVILLAGARVDAAETPSLAGADSGKSVAAEDRAANKTAEEIEKLRKEVNALKQAITANEQAVKAIDERTAEVSTHSDLEALRDIEEENILRSIGSSSSLSPYQVNGGLLHLVNLTGAAGLLYTATPWSGASNSTRSLRISQVSLALSGYLRQDSGAEGDVRYNVAFLATQNRYNAVANSSQSSASSTAATVNASTLNATYLNASDVWVAYDVKTTKLELEPLATLSFQLGQYLIPYGIEAVSTENNRPTINQAQFVSRLGFTNRDLGLIATGGLWHRNDPSATTVPLIGYTLGIFDGAGPNTFDTNTGLDVLGRLTLSPFYQYADNFRNLTIGANWYEGNLWSSTGTLPKKRRLGGDFSWLRKPFLLTAEYVYSKDGYDGRNAPAKGTGAAPTATAAKASTFVGTLFFTPNTLPDFQPWVRFDLWRPWPYTNLTDAQITSANAAGNWGNRRDAYSVGFNWFIWAVEPIVRRSYAMSETWRVLKLQASYTRYRQEAFSGAKNQIDASLIGSF